jgi:hypothetical protein
MKAGLAAINPNPVPEPERTVTHIMPSATMQQAVNARKQRDQEGKADLSALAAAAELEAKQRELTQVRGKLLHFESDKPLRDARVKQLEEEIGRLKAAMGE